MLLVAFLSGCPIRRLEAQYNFLHDANFCTLLPVSQKNVLKSRITPLFDRVDRAANLLLSFSFAIYLRSMVAPATASLWLDLLLRYRSDRKGWDVPVLLRRALAFPF